MDEDAVLSLIPEGTAPLTFASEDASRTLDNAEGTQPSTGWLFHCVSADDLQARRANARSIEL
jgi:hypothetical protein